MWPGHMVMMEMVTVLARWRWRGGGGGGAMVLLLPLLLLPVEGERAVGCRPSPSKAAKNERSACEQCLLWKHGTNNITQADLHLKRAGHATECDANATHPFVCKLWAERCSFTSLPQQFAALPCLRVLFLKGNLILSLDPGALEYNKELEFLDISGNAKLGSLLGPLNNVDDERGPFLRAPALLLLNLSACGVQRLRHSVFSGVTSLQFLFLRANQLRSLPPEVLHPLTQLELLDVSDNPLLSISLEPRVPHRSAFRCLVAVAVPAFDALSAPRDDASAVLRLFKELPSNISLMLSRGVCCSCVNVSRHREGGVAAGQGCAFAEGSALHEERTAELWATRCADCAVATPSLHQTSRSLPAPPTHTATSAASATSASASATTPETAGTNRSEAFVGTTVTEFLEPRCKVPTTAAASAASNNMAAVVVSIVLSLLLLAQSLFVLFLLLRRHSRRSEVAQRSDLKFLGPLLFNRLQSPNAAVGVAEGYRGSRGSPALGPSAYYMDMKFPVTDLDRESFSSINHVYESISEQS